MDSGLARRYAANMGAMYDKVKLWIDRCDVGDGFSHIASHLDEAKELTGLNTGEVSTYGRLQGLKVRMYVGGLSIVGSLPKFLYGGTNIYPLERETTAEAISKIEDALHLSLADAKVTSFEFGCCFLMRHPVWGYLDRLGTMPRMQRCRYTKETLYYKHKGQQQPKTICIYDKIAEARTHQMEISPGLQDSNLLRYEIRFDGRLPQQLKWPIVIASTLHRKEFYKMVMSRYQDAYFSIKNPNKVRPDYMNEIKTVADAFDCFVGKLMNNAGQSQEQVSAFLDELKAAGVFADRKNYTRLKQRIERAATKARLTIADEMVKELDDDVKNSGAYV